MHQVDVRVLGSDNQGGMVHRFAPLTAILALVLACDSPTTAPVEAGAPAPAAEDPSTAVPEPTGTDDVPLEQRIAQFAVAELSADVSGLAPSERKALAELIEASKLLDPVFDRQAWAGNPELELALSHATDPADRERYVYLRIMRGPWDRQAHHEPFATDEPRPPGGGFYPEDLTKADFDAWLADHPADRDAFESLFTVIERTDEGLVARPFSQVYAKWLEPSAQHLSAAAKLTNNESLRTFLEARAKAFRTDDYYVSDKAWMDLDSRVEITIGPYETYEDQLLGLKASFESFVTVSDPAASKALAKYKNYLPKMEKNLPVDDAVKTKRGSESPIRVVDLVFTAGDARTSVQTIAFNLPNDERVRKEKGAKKVLLRNLIETKFDRIMKPIGQRVLVAEHHPLLSGDAFFHQVLFHELSHSLGPAFTEQGGKKVEVRLALGPSYSALEECKADVMGAYNILFMIDNRELPADFRNKLLASYFAGLFRSVRFGVTEAHGQGAAVQINRFISEKAATFDPDTHRFRIDFAQLEKSIEALVRDLVMIQHRGDVEEAKAFLAQHGVMSKDMSRALSQLGGVPVDIRPYYPLAGESGPR